MAIVVLRYIENYVTARLHALKWHSTSLLESVNFLSSFAVIQQLFTFLPSVLKHESVPSQPMYINNIKNIPTKKPTFMFIIYNTNISMHYI